ncbi:MAG: carbon monoxide dehydrogenase subunit G [Hyphomicrobiaceae bacterium]
MKMSGSRELPAPQSEVWRKLNDVDVLQRCIPGCESLEKSGENDLRATVAVKIGPVAARFQGNVTLSDLDPPNSYRISGSGSGGVAGSASGGANVRLKPAGAGTELSYDVDANVTGKIAQLGGRLIDATAASLANQFFDRFAAEFAAGDTAEAAAPAGVAVRPPAGATPAWVWWAVGAALIIGLILLVT